eukprot:CAMPEP_0196575730 /NCGR_PEP_ID=MMETSP1081-20130531/5149_1 /TAXON_ID=36882 /ORGANISM="Pyramimonas amylifera, Strain CCMP720" /LENGTH=942 /DNA_ID=CAMNT_0041894123 /DNA_START=301 /DNA_END=3129 /DNA_ORIENTATION=+
MGEASNGRNSDHHPPRKQLSQTIPEESSPRAMVDNLVKDTDIPLKQDTKTVNIAENAEATHLGEPLVPEKIKWRDRKWRADMVTLIDDKYCQTIMFLFLLVALFAADVAAITSANDRAMVPIEFTLFAILIIYALEFLGNCAARDDYFLGFFFWMDLIGTLSIAGDISWMSQDLLANNQQTLRASRAARVGAKAGRMTRVLKVVRLLKLVFQFVFNPTEFDKDQLASSGGAPTAIGQSVSEAISYQVSSLVLLTVLIVPFLSYEETADAPDAYAALFSRQYEYYQAQQGIDVKSALNLLVGDFNEFFSDSNYEPVEVFIGNFNWTSFDGVSWGRYNDRTADKYEVEEDGVLVGFNVSSKNHESAMFNILFVIYVLVALVVFSAVLNMKTTALVVKPLERIFQVIQEHASHVMGHLDLDLNQQEMEKAVSKVTQLFSKVKNRHKHSVESYIDDAGGVVDAETKAWLIDTYTEPGGGAKDQKKTSMNTAKTKKPSAKNRMSTGFKLPSDAHTSGDTDAHPLLSDEQFHGLLSLMKEKEGNLEELMVVHNLEVIQTWHFDVFLFKEHQLVMCLYNMFDDLGLLDEGLLPVENFWPFMKMVRSKYNDNAYHNFQHCVDVTQTVYRMISLVENRLLLTPVEKFAMLIGAICHDLDHPGVSNAFLVSTRNDLATIYNDTSVLENRHVSLLYQIVSGDPEHNIFKFLPDDGTWKEVRRIIVSIILHTDMVHHFGSVSQLENFLDTWKDELKDNTDMAFVESKDRMFILNCLVHSADISNPVKPYEIYDKWAHCVLEEFFSQGDQERSRNMPISPMMDRDTTSMPLSQVNFIEFVVAPLYTAMCKLFPELKDLVLNLIENRKLYGELYMEEIDRSNKNPEQKEEQKEMMRNRFDKFMEKNKFHIYAKLLKRAMSKGNSTDESETLAPTASSRMSLARAVSRKLTGTEVEK